MPRLERKIRRTTGASRNEMGLLKSGALVAAGATGMHMFDKHKQSSQSSPTPTPPPPQQQNQYYPPPRQDGQYNQSTPHPGQYYQSPRQQGYGQQPQQHQPYQSSSAQRTIECSDYVHQSFCNGTCGERCNGILDTQPTYLNNPTSNQEETKFVSSGN